MDNFVKNDILVKISNTIKICLFLLLVYNISLQLLSKGESMLDKSVYSPCVFALYGVHDKLHVNSLNTDSIVATSIT